MIRLLGRSRKFCDGITRRDLLSAGGLSLLGSLFDTPAVAAPDLERLAASSSGKAKSVIVLYLHGGAATQDMFDLKPQAPAEVRGEFNPIATNVPGIEICEHLPRTARWMHKAAIVRTVNHRSGCHNSIPAFSGLELFEPNQAMSSASHPPSMGAVCEYLHQRGGPSQGKLPAYVCVPNHLGWGELGRRPGLDGGFLGQRFDPLSSVCNPSIDPGGDKTNRARPPEIRGEPQISSDSIGAGVTLDRLDTRWTLLQQLDDRLRRADSSDSVGSFARRQRQAIELLTSPRMRSAFDLEQEPAELRDRYGRSLFGSSALVARKLVESGVRFVNVFWDNYAPRIGIADFGWDTHMHNFITLRDCYLPWLDRTYTALLEDLDGRGLLSETLVVIMSDMGRTPYVNKDAGRDHWTQCYSVVLAGAGIRGGTIYGESDAHAAHVKNKPVSTGDICATIYRCLGIDPDMPVYDRLGRPHPIANGGRALEEILG